MPRPSEVIDKFWKDYKTSPELATDNYYQSGHSPLLWLRRRLKRHMSLLVLMKSRRDV